MVERPPAGLARGEYAWPPWAIATTGIVLFVLGAALWLLLLRRKRGR